MRAPLSWVREFADLPASAGAREVADALVRAGLEVETVEELVVDGPLVLGRVLDFVEEPQRNGRTIRWCTVDVGVHNHAGDAGRGIVCGARNFETGALVVVALPGCVLPGGFAISARRTYGHVSDGMICSAKELGLGDDHTGILVLDPADVADLPVGADVAAALGLPDAVLDIAVTPDRGYCLSIRGIAREAATAYGVAFHDLPTEAPPAATAPGAPAVSIEDGADRIVLRGIDRLDPAARNPLRLRTRVAMAGMRSISLAVDVTNYVMLETGQPLHAFDADRLRGAISVRRARAGEVLETLDGERRPLAPEDLVIADDSGPVALAGVMGGASTEIGPSSRRIVLEAAHFDAVAIARQARRHKLSTEASRRFERGVDHELGPVAGARAVELLARYGGAVEAGAPSEADQREPVAPVEIPVSHPSRVAGTTYPDDVVVARLRDVGCVVEGPDQGRIRVTPPSWRPDLRDPNDLAEEVIRLEGYERVPSRLPLVAPRSGLADAARRRASSLARALAHSGWVEVRTYPFVGEAVLDAFGLAPDDPRRRMVRLANPLSDEEPYLRTTLLPGLLAAARRNLGRGLVDLALWELAPVFLPDASWPDVQAPRPPVTRRPLLEEIHALESALPAQPQHLAGVLTGDVERPGWWGGGRAATWADAIEGVRTVARALRVEVATPAVLEPYAPWHPGRCARVVATVPGTHGGRVIGYAGELHPRVLEALDLPPRMAAFELDLDALGDLAPGLVEARPVLTYPLAKEDVAVVVDEAVPAAAVEDALRSGAGELLESIRLFDVYRDADRIGAGRKSLAYALRFRAPDRTLTVEETNAARDAAVASAARSVGAVQRA
ncbi:MAG TPA: phenylalanine--tRNA ligase subunit beta [Actinomycetes bacterium]|nr:phenylalanine--tRNA ligase subunit beta [Actinomycetes bacterium]